MEVKINVNVTLDASPNLTALVLTALGGRNERAASPAHPIPATPPEWDAPERPDDAPAETAAADTVSAETAAAETGPEAESAPAEYRERPEDVLPLLMQRFGIPADKEERDEEQKRKAKSLSKAVRAVIRDVTKNTAARAISDLRTDDDRREFVKGALAISYNVNDGEFSAMPF